MTKVIALVNMLARLHNFCLEANRATEQDEFDIDRDVVPYQLDNDKQFIMNSDDGFVCMCGSNDHSGSMPEALTDCGHHFDEVPRAIQHHHDCAR